MESDEQTCLGRIRGGMKEARAWLVRKGAWQSARSLEDCSRASTPGRIRWRNRPSAERTTGHPPGLQSRAKRMGSAPLPSLHRFRPFSARPISGRSTCVLHSFYSREGDRLGSGQPLAQEVGDPRRKPPLARLRVCGAKPDERIASFPAGQGRKTRSLTRLNAAVCPCEPSARHSEVRESLAGSSLGAGNGPF